MELNFRPPGAWECGLAKAASEAWRRLEVGYRRAVGLIAEPRKCLLVNVVADSANGAVAEDDVEYGRMSTAVDLEGAEVGTVGLGRKTGRTGRAVVDVVEAGVEVLMARGIGAVDPLAWRQT